MSNIAKISLPSTVLLVLIAILIFEFAYQQYWFTKAK